MMPALFLILPAGLFAFWSPGPVEMLILAAVALILYGGDLPTVARSWGKTFSEFRRGLSGIQNELNDVIYGEPDRLEYHQDTSSPYVASSEATNTEVIEAEVTDTEMPDSEMPDSEMSDSEMSDSEMSDSEMSDSEMSGSGMTLTEVSHRFQDGLGTGEGAVPGSPPEAEQPTSAGADTTTTPPPTTASPPHSDQPPS